MKSIATTVTTTPTPPTVDMLQRPHTRAREDTQNAASDVRQMIIKKEVVVVVSGSFFVGVFVRVSSLRAVSSVLFVLLLLLLRRLPAELYCEMLIKIGACVRCSVREIIYTFRCDRLLCVKDKRGRRFA